MASQAKTVQDKRLRWHCRRGTRELDILLLYYLENHYPYASQAEQSAFSQMLEWPDPDLQDLFYPACNPSQLSNPNPHINHIVAVVCARHQT